MDFSIINKSDTSVELSFTCTDISHINLLRRIMISSVPTCAIERTVIRENTSYMNSEPLSARLSLIPLKHDRHVNDVKLSINVQCTEEETPIYSRDIIVNCKDVSIANGDILIMRLKKGQSINMEAYCKIDCGKTHSKFSPVSVVDLLHRGTDIYMCIESVGQLEPLDILRKSIQILQERNNTLLDKLDEINT